MLLSTHLFFLFQVDEENKTKQKQNRFLFDRCFHLNEIENRLSQAGALPRVTSTAVDRSSLKEKCPFLIR